MIMEYLKRGGFVALVLAAVALAAALFWQLENSTARALADHGVATTAYVVQKQPKAEDGTRAAHEVVYAYQSTAADGTRTTRRIGHEVPQGVFDSVAVGQEIEVRYLPEDPATAEVYPGQHADGRTFLDILALVAASAAAVAALAGLRSARRVGMLAQTA